MISVATALLLASASASTVFAQEGGAAASVAQLVANLRAAPSENDRFRLLSDDQFLFNFNDPNTTVGVTNGAAGRTVAATSGNFPAVVGNGVSMTIGFLGPCGMNSPHTHPRATEINFSLNTTLRGGVLVENGARFAEIDIAPGMATVFPQGAIHFEMNPSCEEAMFVASFNGEDPGVTQIAQRYLGLPPDIVGATLGGLGVQDVANLEALVPDNVIFGVDECLQRCNITRTGQATSQRQPRVSANAFPAGIVPTNVFDLPVAAPTPAPATASSEGGETAPAAGEGEAAPAAGEGEGSGEGESAPAPSEGEGESEPASSEGGYEPTSSEGEGESEPASSEGESEPAPSEGEGESEPAPSEGEGESAPEPSAGEGSGEYEPTEGEGSGEGSSEGEGSGEGEGSSEGEGSGEGEYQPSATSYGGEGAPTPAADGYSYGYGYEYGYGYKNGESDKRSNVVVDSRHPEVTQISLRR